MIRNGIAKWQGSGKEGKGTLSTESGILKDAAYSHGSRFAQSAGTNPEELIAAAHAGCFTMKLSFVLGEAGVTAESIETEAQVSIDNGTIANIYLFCRAKVPGITPEKFAECADNAKLNCPVSKLVRAEVTLDARLV